MPGERAGHSILTICYLEGTHSQDVQDMGENLLSPIKTNSSRNYADMVEL